MYYVFIRRKDLPWEYHGKLYFDYQVDFFKSHIDAEVRVLKLEEITITYRSIVSERSEVQSCLELLNGAEYQQAQRRKELEEWKARKDSGQGPSTLIR